jgi:hypothetical protein
MRSSDLHRYQGYLATTRHRTKTGQKEKMMASQSIYSPDLDKLMKDLKKLDPQLRSTLYKSLTKAVQPVRDTARNLVPPIKPLTNWRQVEPTYQSNSWINDFEHRGKDSAMRWTWHPGNVRRGIKTTRMRRKTGRSSAGREEVSALSVINSDVGGIIYELTGAGKSLGRRTGNKSRNPNAPRDFKQRIITKEGKGKRLLIRAAAMKGGAVQDDIQRILETQLFKFVRG